VSVLRFSHLGLCVSDLPRSLHFYCEGLGFREVSRLDVAGEASDRLLELDGARVQAVYLERDGLRLELFHYLAPGVIGDGAARAMNAKGLTHLSLAVTHLDEVVATLAALGGSVLERTRIDNPVLGARAIFVLDPDGTRIELVQSPADARPE
jgi:catechol 2,3-dioxygenase-like lactoylglutathione lyase family enzyme